MSPIDQAYRYIAACPPAVSGQNGHNTAFSVVCEVINGFNLDEQQAVTVLTPWNATCQPPWSERELLHKVRDAIRLPHQKPRGHKLRNGVSYRFGASETARNHRPPIHAATPPNGSPAASKATPPAQYEVPDSLELPSPMPDGARRLIEAAFRQGDGIRIALARDNGGKEVPQDAGVTLSREEWLRKLNDAGGDPNKFLRTSARNGIFISVNPMKIGGAKDSDVTEYRHALLEFDEISQVEQWGVISKSRVPCAVVLSSGGRSIHAWVKVDAQNRQEYDDRVKVIYDHFKGYAPDEKNKNPSRFSRLAGCERGTSRQELLAVNLGCETFADWLTEIRADGIGRTITIADLDAVDIEHDPNSLLGRRWLCRGGSCLVIGPSGVGKSSLVMQMASCWALARPAFGITPARALKSLVIQAENDDGDLAEMMRGIRGGLSIEPGSADYGTLLQNLVFHHDSTHTGWDFCQYCQRLIERHRPDLVLLDPLLSFIGADISKQEVCGQFLRNWLNPIADATGVAWLMVHHTGKPPADKAKAQKGWAQSDFSYTGLGSSELTNWARAVLILQEQAEGGFRLITGKRGRRAGATHPDGQPTGILHLSHAEKGIFWQQSGPPANQPEAHAGRPSKVEEIACSNMHEFLAGCLPEGEGQNQIARRLEVWLSNNGTDLSPKSCKRAIAAMVENKKLTKNSEGKYVTGSNK